MPYVENQMWNQVRGGSWVAVRSWWAWDMEPPRDMRATATTPKLVVGVEMRGSESAVGL